MKNKLIYKYCYQEELGYEFVYCVYFNEWKEEIEYSLYYLDANDGSSKGELLFQVSKEEFYSKVDGLIKDILLDEIVARVENKLEDLELNNKYKVYSFDKGVKLSDKEFKLDEKSCWAYEDLLNEISNYIDTLNTK